ncbi:L,D-transpeptidase [Streptomyces sp. NPDC004111]|uniref:L,D-transpeptidase n=1 Tax=Streptomyces sp. NPDC004111 TaxID=3364690 RepID=UPI0036B96581
MTTVVAGLALLFGVPLLTPQDPAGPGPAAPPPSSAGPAPTVAPVATVDLAARQLTMPRSGDREARTVPITSGRKETPTATGRMTVTALSATRVIEGKLIGLTDQYDYRASWVVELSGPAGQTTYALAFPSQSKELFGRLDATDGALGLPEADAKWLFQHLRLGDVVEIR